MNLKNLNTLITIADNGSFQQTAAQLNMTLSAVSMQMKGLEEELGIQLFDRTYRPPKLTPMGRGVVERARTVSRESAALIAACYEGNGVTGRFRIGFVGTSSVRLLPSFLMNARTHAPQASFVVETGLSDELVERVSHGDLDAAVVTSASLPRLIKSHVLATEELLFCLPEQMADWSIERCMEELPFVHFMPKTGIGQLIADHLSEQRHAPKEVIVLDSVEAVAECVLAGVGFGILPKPDVERHANEGIILRQLAPKPLTRQLVFVHQQRGVVADNADEILSFFNH
ncbi:MAG: LysR family transcriptional regulator [Hyphomicrobiales bacterium]